MSFERSFIDSVLETRQSINILIEGEYFTIFSTESLNDEEIDSIEEVTETYDFPILERVQIKRKYSSYEAFRVNREAPIRNRVVEFVGKRFITEDELKNFLTKLEEERGNAIDDRKWFSRNQKYFESFKNRGQQVWTLSKYGKRVLEYIVKEKSQRQIIKESLGLFKY
jgi:hypothetical protein